MKICDQFYQHRTYPMPALELVKQAKIVAHRGEHTKHKENTLSSIEACLRNGIYAVEFDIRWTKDLVPILFHDLHAGRVFGRPDISPHQYSFQELRKVLPEIPSLEEALQAFGKKIHLMMEIKKPAIGFSKSQQMQKILSQKLAGLEPEKDFHFLSLSSKNFHLVDAFPRSSMALVSDISHKKALQEAMDFGLKNFCGHYLLTNGAIIKKCKEHGINYSTGYIFSKDLAFREIARGCQWLFSNNAIDLQRQIQTTLLQATAL
tara:strand:+ start:2173 stop:2958 length:786 start_codon:yes stop_codon:yes gene_type:complete